MPSNHLILCCPLFLLPSIFQSIRVFSSESALCIRWPEYWSFSFSISPSSGYSGLISFRIDWFNLLAVQGALKSLLQNHSSKASILWYSAFLMVQLSHPYVTTGKIIALTSWTLLTFYHIADLVDNRYLVAVEPRFVLLEVLFFNEIVHLDQAPKCSWLAFLFCVQVPQSAPMRIHRENQVGV